MPVYVNAVLNNLREIKITDPAMESFVFDGAMIVGNIRGSIGRVLRREGLVLTLTEDWRGVDEGIWVVPPAINGGRNPCIAVHQRVIRF
jgi:hypothetical protein